MDRCRLEEAFLLYASLEVIQRHNLWKEIATLPCDRNEMIEHVTKHYSHAFSNKWEGNLICIAYNRQTRSNRGKKEINEINRRRRVLSFETLAQGHAPNFLEEATKRHGNLQIGTLSSRERLCANFDCQMDHASAVLG